MVRTKRKYALILVHVMSAHLLVATSAQAGVFNNQQRSLKIRFDAYTGTETLTNFPVLVTFNTGITNFSYSSFKSPADGADLRFANSNLSEALNYEIEKWDSNGNSYVWVQVPALSSSNDFIWALWGGSAYTTPPPYATNGDTWSAEYAAVWHLNTICTDSTANRNEGTPSGNPTNVLTAMIAGGMDLVSPPPTNYASCNNSASLSITGSVTVSAWVYWRNGRGFMSKEYQSNSGYAAEIDDGAGKIRWYTWGLSGSFDTRSSSSLPSNEWHHLALVYDNDKGKKLIYFDGILNTSADATGSITQNVDSFYLGFSKLSGNVSQYLDGMLDEMRVENTARSSNWLWTCRLNQESNSNFIAFEKVLYRGGTLITIR
jgi:hypothetical protein